MDKKSENPISRTTALIANSKAIKGLKATITALLVFITLFGIVGFSLFILQEAGQTTLFSFWQSMPAERWDITMEGLDLLAGINSTGKAINAAAGWINPLSYASYNAFHKATDQYIKALTARVLANEPSLFIGRQVKFTFKPKQTESLQNGNFAHVNRNLKVITGNRPGENGYISAVGILEKVGKYLIIDMTSKNEPNKRSETK